jgi:cell division protein FtsN
VTRRHLNQRARRRPAHRSRLLGLFALAGALALGVTLVAGVVSARRWWSSSEAPWAVASGWKYWLGVAPRKSAAEAAADKARARQEPTAPVLTFYHELTAPLVPPPPPPRPKPAMPERPATTSVGTQPTPVLPPGLVAPRADAGLDPGGGRFTIQVGAYRTREPAEALRARLAGGEDEVYIVESGAAETVRYRVRVGSFASAEAARAAAVKLATERQVSTYVTSR